MKSKVIGNYFKNNLLSFCVSAILPFGLIQFTASQSLGKVVFGGDSSGGGNAKLCFTSASVAQKAIKNIQKDLQPISNEMVHQIVSVEMLDLLKANQIKETISAHAGESLDSFRERSEARLGELYPYVLEVLESGQARVSQTRSVPGGLNRINDVGSPEVYGTNNCIRHTILAHQSDIGGYHIIKDERIFDLSTDVFSVENRLISEWHEYIYIALKEMGWKSSEMADWVQTFVGTMAYEELTLGELSSVFGRLRLDSEHSSEAKYYGIIGQFFNIYNKRLVEAKLTKVEKDVHVSGTGKVVISGVVALATMGTNGIGPALGALLGLDIGAEIRSDKKCKKFYNKLVVSQSLTERKSEAFAILLDAKNEIIESLDSAEAIDIIERIYDEQVQNIQDMESELHIHNESYELETWRNCVASFLLAMPYSLLKANHDAIYDLEIQN